LQALNFGVRGGFFLCGDFCVFAGVFGKLGAQNVVFCVVNDGQIVVKVWWKMPCKCGAEDVPRFEDLFLVGPVRDSPGSDSDSL
jgi:hypothetical protein